MTFNYTYNSRERFILHAVANSTANIAGNSSVSNVAGSSQNLTGASITRVWFGSDGNGSWNIKRGSNLIYSASGSGYHYFDGALLTVDRTGNISVELVGSSNGFIMIELKKEGVLG